MKERVPQPTPAPWPVKAEVVTVVKIAQAIKDLKGD